MAGVEIRRLALKLSGIDEREGERLSDSQAFDLVHRLRERGVKARIIAECVEDANRPRLR